MSRRIALLVGLGLALLSLNGCKDEDTNLPFTFTLSPVSPVTGPVPIFFTLTTDGSDATVDVDVSLDDGATFTKATEANGQPNPTVLAGAPAGTQQFFHWDPVADVGPGIHRRVVIRIVGRGKDVGVVSQTPRFVVDLTDRLSALPGGPQPQLSRPLALPLPDGTVWVAGGESGGQLNGLGYRYDPVNDQLTSSTGLGSASRRVGGALLSGGQALVAGGYQISGDPSSATATLSLVAGGSQLVGQAPLQVARGAPAVAALADGRAVIVGGEVLGGGSTPAVEVLTPGAGSTVLAFNDTALARREHSATALTDGRVLVAGGFDDSGAPVARAVVIDAGVSAATAASSAMGNPRGEHAAVRLPDGRVAIVGGTTRLGEDTYALATAEIFSPDTNSFTPLPSMTRRRRGAAAVYVGGGLVVFGGGGPSGAATTAERYDFATQAWSEIAGASGTSRPDAVAMVSGNGRTIVLGGGQPPERYTPDASLTAESFSALNAVPQPRADHTATLLDTGEVLLVGGTAGVDSAVATVELVSPDATELQPRRSMRHARSGHAATLIHGQVLVLGGRDASGLVGEAEVYDSATDTWSSAGTLNTPRVDPSATALPDGTVLVAGGTDSTGAPVAQLERWNPQQRAFVLQGALTTARADHDTVLIRFGDALIGPGQGAAGPVGDVDMQVPFAGAGLFHLSGGTPRAGAALVELPRGSGLVLVTGGVDGSGTRGDLDLVDGRVTPPVFAATGRSLQVPRSGHRATSLASGVAALLAGGRNARGLATDEHEIYAITQSGSVDMGATRRPLDVYGHRPRARHTATRLRDGRVLLVGGVDDRGVVIAGAEVYEP
jgi:hypothetical protein